jgi:hypothetical protein
MDIASPCGPKKRLEPLAGDLFDSCPKDIRVAAQARGRYTAL